MLPAVVHSLRPCRSCGGVGVRCPVVGGTAAKPVSVCSWCDCVVRSSSTSLPWIVLSVSFLLLLHHSFIVSLCALILFNIFWSCLIFVRFLNMFNLVYFIFAKTILTDKIVSCLKILFLLHFKLN